MKNITALTAILFSKHRKLELAKKDAADILAACGEDPEGYFFEQSIPVVSKASTSGDTPIEFPRATEKAVSNQTREKRKSENDLTIRG